MDACYQSWGGYPKVAQPAVRLNWRHERLPVSAEGGQTYLPFGNGRSYGDSCLNTHGMVLDMRGLSRFIAFDPDAGTLRCEAGVLLSDVLALVVPHGWFLPVTPGTKLVTVGGAIANDVHGKNHHRAGTFGCHVRRFELLRSDGQRLLCSAEENADWFRATIGGLGLTGVILWAEFALKSICNTAIEAETIRFSNLGEFMDLSAASDQGYEYTVAWIDCLAKGRGLGRGLFMRGNHAAVVDGKLPPAPRRRLSVALAPPVSVINGLSVRAFNTFYYRKQWHSRRRSIVHYEPFFYPLDGIGQWNRLYGKQGFLQYQCVVPQTDGRAAIEEMLRRIAKAGSGSFLAVLKIFGKRPSPGLLSFPRPGITLALDFPYRGAKTLHLLQQLDEIVMTVRGSVYPAKDARMTASCFKQYYPHWERLKDFQDPQMTSTFWQRVTQE
jgi:FAD/FMN-containing dehydrogenase